MEDTGQIEEPEEAELSIREGIRAKLARVTWRALEIAALVGTAIGDIHRKVNATYALFPITRSPHGVTLTKKVLIHGLHSHCCVNAAGRDESAVNCVLCFT
jgi:hypothetical protein